MKVEQLTKEEGFKPVQFKITLETQEEVDAVYALGWTNGSVPEAVANSRKEHLELKSCVSRFLNILRSATSTKTSL